MATHAAGFSVLWSSEAAEADAPSSADAISVASDFVQVGAVHQAPVGPSGGVLNTIEGVSVASCGRGGLRSTALSDVVSFQGYIVAAGGTFAATCTGSLEWSIDGTRLANGVASILGTPRSPPTVPTFQLGGAALAATGVPTVIFGVATVAHPQPLAPYFGRAAFNEFVQIPPDQTFNVPAALARLRQQMVQSGSEFELGTQSNGDVRSVRDCEFAAMDPRGWVWLRPEDIGNQIEQIPADIGQNSAEHFRFFPNAFFRRTSYVDGLQLAVVDSTSITEPADALTQPFTLATVEFVPQNSTWLFIVDGQPYCVRILHPEGSDFRRPDEIWNGVIVPALQNARGPSTSLDTRSPFTFVFFNGESIDQTGLVDRLRYLQYATMLKLNEGGGGITVVFIPQGSGNNN